MSLMLVQMIINGLAMGAIYALIALGFVMIYNSTGAVNFAQGDFAMIGAYLYFTATVLMHQGVGVAFLVVIAGSVLLGLVFNRVVFYPLRDKHWMIPLIGTIGASIFLPNFAMNIWGPEPLPTPNPFGKTMLQVGELRISPQFVLIVFITVVMIVTMHLFFSRTRFGKMMQATAQDRTMARLSGIRVKQTMGATFVYSSVLAGIAGALVAPLFFVYQGMGLYWVVKAFCATIIGGFGSVPGAIVGGFFVGVLEQLCAGYVSDKYKDVYAFLLMILVLFVRPQGIFGEKISEKV